ncbi:MAG: hypothetical protein HYY03_02380 [Chloroflexi bacterium]|nr:hypothetical protein [Chloroflexota bacterium]
MRVAVWTAVLALGVLAAVACGGGENSGDNDGPAGGQGAKVTVSCDAIHDIRSYRYSISVKLQSPDLDGSDQGTPADAFSAFAQALTSLFADMRMEGAYVAPDRSQAVLRFQDEEVEVRAIGDQSWLRVGNSWQEQESAAEPGSPLTPQTICDDTVKGLAPSLSAAQAERETINGVETDHYRLDQADLENLPGLLGSGAGSDLPQQFAVDVWLARDGRWPVRLNIGASDTNEQGQPIGLQLSMEFSDVNDPSIEIEPPVVSPAEA